MGYNTRSSYRKDDTYDLEEIEIKEKIIDNYYVGGLEEVNQDLSLKKFHIIL